MQHDAPITARTLVLDLLGANGRAGYSTAQLVCAGAAFGLAAVGMRTAIARLKAQGRVRQVARGAYAIGPAGEPLQRRLRDWRNVLSRRAAWNGAWLMAIAGPVERADRNAWRRTLRALDFNGFAEAEAGLWVRPDNLVGGAPGARVQLADFGHADTLMVVSAHDVDDDRDARFRALWDAATLTASLADIADRLERHAEAITRQSPAQAAADTLLLGRAAIRAIVHDPLLPDALCAPAGLARLIAQMTRYDRLGRQAWQAYLGGA